MYEDGEGRESVKGNLEPLSLMAPELCLLIPVWLSQKRVMPALDTGVDNWENWTEGAGVRQHPLQVRQWGMAWEENRKPKKAAEVSFGWSGRPAKQTPSNALTALFYEDQESYPIPRHSKCLHEVESWCKHDWGCWGPRGRQPPVRAVLSLQQQEKGVCVWPMLWWGSGDSRCICCFLLTSSWIVYLGSLLSASQPVCQCSFTQDQIVEYLSVPGTGDVRPWTKASIFIEDRGQKPLKGSVGRVLSLHVWRLWLDPQHHIKPGKVSYTCNPSIQEEEAVGS